MHFRVRLYLEDGTDVCDIGTMERVWRPGDVVTIAPGEQYRVLAVADRDPSTMRAPLDEVSPYLAFLTVERV